MEIRREDAHWCPSVREHNHEQVYESDAGVRSRGAPELSEQACHDRQDYAHHHRRVEEDPPSSKTVDGRRTLHTEHKYVVQENGSHKYVHRALSIHIDHVSVFQKFHKYKFLPPML